MWLVLTAMRRPITFLVAVVAVALCSIAALRRMQIDIFPNLGAPAIYVAQPYAGMSPAQMESFLTYNYEYQFFYINGIEHVESKSIQGAARMKLVFHPGTDMNQAMSQVVASVNRARANMPAGTVPPFIVRFDAGSVPVAQLVFSSPTRPVGEMQDLAVTRVRPMFASLPGVSAPPPFGASSRAIVVRLDPVRLRAYHVSPEEAITAVNQATSIMPAGNVRIGDLMEMAITNATIGSNFDELLATPIRVGQGPTVYLRDIGTVGDGTDITAGFAHVNGKRTVYIPVTKRADASTLAVIEEVKKALPAMRNLVPADVEVRMEFDQSRYVSNAIDGLFHEGMVGALLTGLMVLLFLRDWRSALIVLTTIPFALLSAVVCLWAFGQTINIMTLGGLALAVGVLVDEATVEIENIHTHMATGIPRALAVAEAARKTALARLLSMLAILSVFVPSFFMVGVGQQLFVPLALAVGCAMVSSYLLSSTLVPVLSTWLMRTSNHTEEMRGLFGLLRSAYAFILARMLKFRWPVVAAYVLVTGGLLYFLWPRIGTEIFPNVEGNQLQIRLRAPTGTRIERTELIAIKTLDVVKHEVGPENVLISTDYVGAMPSANPNNTIYLWTSGPHEAVIRIAFSPSASLHGEALKERLRAKLHETLPTVTFSFEPGDIVSQVMSFGSPTPVEVAVQGPNLADDQQHAEKIRRELAKVSSLRDLDYGQPQSYPTLNVLVNRDRAGQLGLTMSEVAHSLVASTSSSRFIEPNFWRDPKSGNGYQIQVEVPENQMRSAEDVLGLPLVSAKAAGNRVDPLLRDVAVVEQGNTTGEIDRYNMQRMISLTANIHGKVLGDVARDVRDAIKRTGPAPRGTTVEVRGQIAPLEETLVGLRNGLLLSILVIFLLLAANFQSIRLAFVVISTVPAVLCGVTVMLLLTGTTLNVQSFMGAIMSVGIAVANAILLVTFAEIARREGRSVRDAAIAGGTGRLRAILMTAAAMIAGMIPIALALGEGSEQTAPLGRAVIGGLVSATGATLLVIPAAYSILQKAGAGSPSVNPYDPASRNYVPNAAEHVERLDRPAVAQ
jgi:multidrug efflux pump subunit AcrB